jgi:hypothetical protein
LFRLTGFSLRLQACIEVVWPRWSWPLAIFLVACSSPHSHAPPPPPGPPPTEVVVGIQSEPFNGALDSIRVVTTLDGATHSDESFGADALPHEVKLLPPNGDVGAMIGVQVSGFLSAVGTGPLLVRTAETGFVPEQTLLLRVLLQGQCLLPLPGLVGGPTCAAPQTCIAGVCQDDQVSPQGLEMYAMNWAASTPDICKPLNGGPPVLQVGTGQSDYLPVQSGDTVQAEQGPQGGHHIWIAVRQRNLKQSGSTTTITSVQPNTGLMGPRTAFAFTFDQDQGGFCKLFGLRYQLDADGTDYHLFLGQPLDVTVVIADQTGASATGVAHFNIASQPLCASGTTGGC